MTVVISLISSLIAAFIAHYLATSRNQAGELLKFQIQSYSDFIGAASRLAVSRRLGNTDSEEADLVALNDAKNRIITCGHREVVEALLHFWEQGATLERENELLAFKNLTQVMRSALGHKSHDLFELDIGNGLFRLEPSNFSYRAKESAKKVTENKIY
ncbi:hypothetical protein [Neptuniibacter caesariensis]|uniref:Uncharacterized protein n=1 Tax=Neptuniibacter caesariensis TaxID=207954 RepID=A0A7U8GT40_NEPCE|nr:hypothetical protein [Neptuniibacter caesariensis]EAR62036.1 hypothetical protein MED92_10034 [Oceanospirillum sp. MED92] [Neptuniibacter caesariensis]